MAHLVCDESVREKLSQDMTLMRRQHTGDPIPTILCQAVDDGLLIPRSHPLNANKVALDRSTWKDFRGYSVLTTLRDAQKELVDAFMESLAQHAPYGGIVSMPTGGGKSIIGMEIISKLNMPTLIIVPRAVLIQQWKDRILEHTNLTENDIGLVRQSECNYKGKKIVIGLIHSLAQREYAQAFYDYFGVVLTDEVHVCGAETFATVAPKFDAPVRVGLSATVERKDGMANCFLWHIGPVVAKTTELKVRPKVVQVRYFNPASSHTGLFWNGKLILARYLNRIATIPARNVFIGNLVVALYKKGHHILVLSDRLPMLHELKRLVAGETGSDKVGLFIGQEKDLGKQILLGTYGSAGLGADIPRITALVFASPRVDVVQATGRALRQGEPLVYDIVDTASSVMQGWAHVRMKYYRQIATQIVVKTFTG
jgi:hypothetical protein